MQATELVFQPYDPNPNLCVRGSGVTFLLQATRHQRTNDSCGNVSMWRLSTGGKGPPGPAFYRRICYLAILSSQQSQSGGRTRLKPVTQWHLICTLQMPCPASVACSAGRHMQKSFGSRLRAQPHFAMLAFLNNLSPVSRLAWHQHCGEVGGGAHQGDGAVGGGAGRGEIATSSFNLLAVMFDRAQLPHKEAHTRR